jgi:hypothetical protein
VVRDQAARHREWWFSGAVVAQHNVITARIRQFLPYGVKYTKEKVWKEYQEHIYVDLPGYLLSIARYF